MNRKNMKTAAIIIVLAATASIASAQQKFGDNLGNHKATKDINANTFNILNASGVAIGSANFTNSSIALQVDGADKAILVPRVAANSAIVDPLNGMIIYNTTDKKFYLYQGGDNLSAGGAWVTFALAVKEATDGINTTSNDSGYTLTQVGQETVLKLSPASATMPGIVTIDTQEFSGNKTFTDSVNVNRKTVLNADTVSGGLTLKNAKVGSGLLDERFLVIGTDGKIKKSVQSPYSTEQRSVVIPTVTLPTNTAVMVTISGVPNLKKNDGVVINFDADDLTNNPDLAYISIISATATADGVLVVTLADLRQEPESGPALSDAGALLTGKHFTMTRYHLAN